MQEGLDQQNVLWYKKSADGKMHLVRPGGTQGSTNQKPEGSRFSTRQAVEGWQRAILFMQQFEIRDATSFSCSMETMFCWPLAEPDDSTCVLILAAPQTAEERIYPYLTEEQVRRCRENVEGFYGDPNLQADWSEWILYGVSIVYRLEDHSFRPVSFREIPKLRLEWDAEMGESPKHFSNLKEPELQQFLEQLRRKKGICPFEPYTKDWLQWLAERTPDWKAVTFWHEKEKNGCFSQWYPAPFTVEGIRYATCEQYMMSRKALLFGDTAAYQRILAEADPRKCKHLGGQVTPFCSKDWDAAKREIVFRGNLEKFRQNPALLDMLLDTADAVLAEASPLDCVWGAGLAKEQLVKEDDTLLVMPAQWSGENLLGLALMHVRTAICGE